MKTVISQMSDEAQWCVINVMNQSMM